MGGFGTPDSVLPCLTLPSSNLFPNLSFRFSLRQASFLEQFIICPGSFPSNCYMFPEVANILKRKANSWPCVQADRAQKEEEIATHEPPELCIMPILIDSGRSQSENTVKPHDVYCYERLRDQITELFRALKSTYDGNEVLVKALAENPSLDLLQQCDQLIDDEINEYYDRAIAEYQERMSYFMHGDGGISTP